MPVGVVRATVGVSIRPRPFGRGERSAAWWEHASELFQSALALSGEGNGPAMHRKHGGAGVSIRPRPFGRGERYRAIMEDGNWQVSIRPRPFGRGEPAFRSSTDTPVTGFQSALALSGEGNSVAECVVCLLGGVSIRPRPFGRGELHRDALLRSPESFQSALALSGEGNAQGQFEAVEKDRFQSALALSGEGNRKPWRQPKPPAMFQSALALSGEGNRGSVDSFADPE